MRDKMAGVACFKKRGVHTKKMTVRQSVGVS